MGAWTRLTASRNGDTTFVPDYRYVGRFIRKKAETEGAGTACVLCLTATAKPDVDDGNFRLFSEGA